MKLAREFRGIGRAVMMRPATASRLCAATFPDQRRGTVHGDPESRRRWENRWQKRVR
jgi:hypothetical protein